MFLRLFIRGFCFPGVVGFDFLDCSINFPFLGFEKIDPHNILFEYWD